MEDENSGFHYTLTGSGSGNYVPPELLANASLIDNTRVRPWQYDKCSYGEVPTSARIERYFYSHEDLMELTQWSMDQSVKRARKGKWRYRVDPTTKIREYYLMDIIWSDWKHFLDMPGTNFDVELLEEARDRRGLMKSRVSWVMTVMNELSLRASRVITG